MSPEQTRWWRLAVPVFALAAAVGVLLVARGFGDARCDRFADVAWQDLTRPGRCVRVAGMAHSAASLVSPEGQIVVPLFPQGNTQGREVRMFVRSTRAPSFVVDFEEMTVEGRAVPATPDTVLPGSAEELARRGYTLADRILVLQADRIDGGEGAWTSRP